MNCSNCQNIYPGKIIKVNNPKEKICIKCGKKVPTTLAELHDMTGTIETAIAMINNTSIVDTENIKKWDRYFYSVCTAISTNSPCLSRKIGAVLVRDKSIISTGYNGPARGYQHCANDNHRSLNCPRKQLGYLSGQGLDQCPATHAEANCIANAARIGASTVGSTLYMNCIVPCKDCASLLVNAGVVEVVVESLTLYHAMSTSILKDIKLRRFEL